jgi:two-component system sensor histidine kinase/response regulator
MKARTTLPDSTSPISNDRVQCMSRVLLVDNNVGLLSALSELLKERKPGVLIDTALTAEAALSLIRDTEYDAVITDLRMPGMDGLGLLKKARLRRPETPVVLMTGYGDREVEDKALHLGAYAFIHKPVEPDVFVSVVSRALLKAQVLRRSTEQYLRLKNQPIQSNVVISNYAKATANTPENHPEDEEQYS